MRYQTREGHAQTVRRTAVTMVLLGGAICLPLPAFAASTGTPPARTVHVPPGPTIGPAQIDAAAMVERYGPAVVNISASQNDQQAVAPTLDNLDPDDPVFTWFRAAAAEPPAQPSVPDPPRVIWGSGSGFIISSDGLVATTAHVVSHAEQVTVTLTDRRQLKADVLAVDPQTDVALLQIKGATKLPFIRVGDASRVRVGERVLTIGSPDGPQNDVTSGLVSVTPHVMSDGTPFIFFETDIAPDPDNSGGPLLDPDGAAIGVNVQIYADTGRYRSLTLAIPIDSVVKLRAQLQGQGKLAGGSLGIQAQDVDPGLAAAFGLPRATGALVTAVAPAPHGAAASNLKPGDVITRINGKTIEHQADLSAYVSALQPGAKVQLTIVRNKKPMTVTTVIAMTTDNAAPVVPVSTEGSAAERLGLTVHALSESEKRSTGLPLGVVVDGTSGAAANAGIQPGDIILSVNSELVSTREALDSLIARGGKQVALLIQRDNVRSFVSLAVK